MGLIKHFTSYKAQGCVGRPHGPSLLLLYFPNVQRSACYLSSFGFLTSKMEMVGRGDQPMSPLTIGNINRN